LGKRRQKFRKIGGGRGGNKALMASRKGRGDAFAGAEGGCGGRGGEKDDNWAQKQDNRRGKEKKKGARHFIRGKKTLKGDTHRLEKDISPLK